MSSLSQSTSTKNKAKRRAGYRPETKGAKRHKGDRDHDDEDEDYNNAEEENDEFKEDDIIEITNKNETTLDDGLTEEGRRARDEAAA